jgi:hypothetical protein
MVAQRGTLVLMAELQWPTSSPHVSKSERQNPVLFRLIGFVCQPHTHAALQVLALIGEQFTEGDEVCGVTVNIRGKGDRVELWTRTAANEAAQVRHHAAWSVYSALMCQQLCLGQGKRCLGRGIDHGGWSIWDAAGLSCQQVAQKKLRVGSQHMQAVLCPFCFTPYRSSLVAS